MTFLKNFLTNWRAQRGNFFKYIIDFSWFFLRTYNKLARAARKMFQIYHWFFMIFLKKFLTNKRENVFLNSRPWLVSAPWVVLSVLVSQFPPDFNFFQNVVRTLLSSWTSCRLLADLELFKNVVTRQLPRGLVVWSTSMKSSRSSLIYFYEDVDLCRWSLLIMIYFYEYVDLCSLIYFYDRPLVCFPEVNPTDIGHFGGSAPRQPVYLRKTEHWSVFRPISVTWRHLADLRVTLTQWFDLFHVARSVA